MNNHNEFKKYATKHLGINSLTLDTYSSIYGNYISPTITEERKLNVATMDVFSRLMMDRIIFWVFQLMITLLILFRRNFYF